MSRLAEVLSNHDSVREPLRSHVVKITNSFNFFFFLNCHQSQHTTFFPAMNNSSTVFLSVIIHLKDRLSFVCMLAFLSLPFIYTLLLFDSF